MKNRFAVLLLCLMAATFSVQAQSSQTLAEKQKEKAAKQQSKIEKQKAKAATKESKKKAKKEKDPYEAFGLAKTAGCVYIFGTSTTLGTDEVLITEISQIDSLAVQKKTLFLPFRSSFSLQLQQYTEGTLGKTNQTTSIFFDENKKKLEKRLDKVKRHILTETSGTLTFINAEQFHFVHPLDLMFQSDEDTVE